MLFRSYFMLDAAKAGEPDDLRARIAELERDLVAAGWQAVEAQNKIVDLETNLAEAKRECGKLAAKLAKAREALEPIARLCERLDEPAWPDNKSLWLDTGYEQDDIPLLHLRNARAAIAEIGQ